MKLSIEVITFPVSDVERALRFYVDQLALRSTSTTHRTTPSALCSSLRQDQAAQCRLVRDLPMHKDEAFCPGRARWTVSHCSRPLSPR